MRRLDLIIFLVVIGWMALKFIGAWLEQRPGREPKEDDDQAPAGGAKERRRPMMAPPPSVRRPRVNPPPSPAESAPPPELGELRDWFREALKQARPSLAPADGGGGGMAVPAARPPVLAPLEVEAEMERDGVEPRAASPLGVLDGALSQTAVAVSARRSRPAAAALLRATRRRQSLRQGILLAEVLGRPRAFDA